MDELIKKFEQLEEEYQEAVIYVLEMYLSDQK